MSTELTQEIMEWEEWASTADRKEDGWESYYPDWLSLMKCAAHCMCKYIGDDAVFAALERCWSLSQEGEELLDFAQENIQECFNVLVKLVESDDSGVRWQVYVALASAGLKGEPIIRAGLEDSDNYARRRALLSLVQLRPVDGDELAERFMVDKDPYMRQASAKLLLGTRNQELLGRAGKILLNDPVDFVKEAAKELLPLE